jgi:nuclear pore complex protein Nup98-Nup96
MEIAGTAANLVTKTQVCQQPHLLPSSSYEAMLTTQQQANRNAVLKLPLTEDLWLKHSIDLSTRYYRSIMVSGR